MPKTKPKKKELKPRSVGKQTHSARNTGGKKSRSVKGAVREKTWNWHISIVGACEGYDMTAEIFSFSVPAVIFGGTPIPPTLRSLLEAIRQKKITITFTNTNPKLELLHTNSMKKTSNTTKKKHKIGKCGAIIFETKYGSVCAECGKKIKE